MKTVRDIMSTNLITVEEDMSVKDLALLLTGEEITGAPVVDAHGEVVGVVSSTDVVQLAAREREVPLPREFGNAFYVREGTRSPELTPESDWLDWTRFDARIVREIMNPLLHSIGADTTIGELAELLLNRRIHRALVFEDDELVGIVTTYDVLRWVVDEHLAGPADAGASSMP